MRFAERVGKAAPVAVLAALAVAMPAASSGRAAAGATVGRFSVISDSVFVSGDLATASGSVKAGTEIRTSGQGQVSLDLRLKHAHCTIWPQTRLIVKPTANVAFKVISAHGEILCGASYAQGVLDVVAPDGTRISTRDPVFALVFRPGVTVVKVVKGAVVVARRGHKGSILIRRTKQAIVPRGDGIAQVREVKLSPTEKAEVQALQAPARQPVTPPPADTTPPRLTLVHTPPKLSAQSAARFAFTSDDAAATFTCAFDSNSFYVCASPLEQSLGPGRHTFAVRATDPAGNASALSEYEWTVRPPTSGQVVFEEQTGTGDRPSYQIFRINSDATGRKQLTNTPTGNFDPAWSPDHTQIAFESDRVTQKDADIYVMNADGTGQTRLTTDPAHDRVPAWSPDDSKIAFESRRDGNPEIYSMNADGTDQVRLTYDPADDTNPTWSPDGSEIAFETNRDGYRRIYVMNADGSDQRPLNDAVADDRNPEWSPDGTHIAFYRVVAGNADVYVMRADGTDVTQVTDDPGYDADPSWSPDGSSLAFTAGRSGNLEIWAINADGTNPGRLTRSATERDLVPSW